MWKGILHEVLLRIFLRIKKGEKGWEVGRKRRGQMRGVLSRKYAQHFGQSENISVINCWIELSRMEETIFFQRTLAFNGMSTTVLWGGVFIGGRGKNISIRECRLLNDTRKVKAVICKLILTRWTNEKFWEKDNLYITSRTPKWKYCMLPVKVA